MFWIIIHFALFETGLQNFLFITIGLFKKFHIWQLVVYFLFLKKSNMCVLLVKLFYPCLYLVYFVCSFAQSLQLYLEFGPNLWNLGEVCFFLSSVFLIRERNSCCLNVSSWSHICTINYLERVLCYVCRLVASMFIVNMLSYSFVHSGTFSG